MAAGDVNRDGHVDLLTAHNAHRDFAVLLGTASGRFRAAQPYTGPGTTDLAVGDLDADGHLDVALGTDGDSVAVRLGAGDGTFGPARAYPAGSDAFGVRLGHLNRDHHLDLAVADFGDNSVSALLGAGDGTFGRRRNYRMRGHTNVDTALLADC